MVYPGSSSAGLTWAPLGSYISQQFSWLVLDGLTPMSEASAGMPGVAGVTLLLSDHTWGLILQAILSSFM